MNLGNLTSLDQAVSRMAALDPEHCFVCDARDPDAQVIYRYRQAERLINALASQLATLEHPRIGVLLSSSYHCLCQIYAVIRSGKDLVLLDPEWGLGAKQSIIREMDLRVLLALDGCEAELSPRVLTLDFSARVSAFALAPARAAASRVIVFTSGTTSRPKGIVLTQAALIYAYTLGAQCLGISWRTRAGCFYRLSGLGILGIHCLFPILQGGSVTLMPPMAYFDVDGFWQLVQALRINFLYIVPPIANYLVKEGRPLAEPWHREQLLCVSGSARLDAEIQRQFQQSFAPLANIYGLSECGFAFLFGQVDGAGYSNSVGPARGLELRLKDADGQLITEALCQGRLYVKTQSLFETYVNQPELTARVVEQGWLDTQDLAYFDAAGSYYLVGRCDGTINKGGNLFHLVECDELLLKHEQVIEACSLKVPCALYGEDYIAFARIKPRRAALDFLPYLNQGLGMTRAPRRVVVCETELPRNAAGKYDRQRLLALAGL